MNEQQRRNQRRKRRRKQRRQQRRTSPTCGRQRAGMAARARRRGRATTRSSKEYKLSARRWPRSREAMGPWQRSLPCCRRRTSCQRRPRQDGGSGERAAIAYCSPQDRKVLVDCSCNLARSSSGRGRRISFPSYGIWNICI